MGTPRAGIREDGIGIAPHQSWKNTGGYRRNGLAGRHEATDREGSAVNHRRLPSGAGMGRRHVAVPFSETAILGARTFTNDTSILGRIAEREVKLVYALQDEMLQSH
ncbi:hypothetical protein [Mesorhizobium sp. M1378]|uniref:hypothetical protein n=1 Tax=Mesorhizobium sp. M1378 TaxID=2957092 RepID=UPI00333A064D